MTGWRRHLTVSQTFRSRFMKFGRNAAASMMIYGGFVGAPSPWFMVFYLQIVSLLLILTAIERRMGNG